MELDGIKYSSVHTPWGPHPDLFNHPMNAGLRNSSVTEFRSSTAFGWDYIVGGPEKGWVYLIRFRYLAAALSPGRAHSFLVSGTYR